MYKLFLVVRYVLKLLSLLSVVFIAGSVMLLVAVPSVMNGFQHEFLVRVRGTQSDLSIWAERPLSIERHPRIEEALSSVEGVVGVAPYIEYPAIDRHFNKADYCFMRAIVPSLEEKVSDFRKYILSDYERYLAINEYDMADAQQKRALEYTGRDLRKEADPDSVYRALEEGGEDPDNPGKRLPGVVPGIFFLHAFQLDKGDVVKLTTASEGGEVKQDQRFLIVGAVRSGTSATDRRFLYISLPALQEFLGVKGKVTGYSIKLADHTQIKRHRGKTSEPPNTRDRVEDAVRTLMRETVPGTNASYLPKDLLSKSWEERDENLLKAVAMERAIIKSIMFMVVAGSALSMFFFLVMEVLMKVREIGILRSMGGSRWGVFAVFVGKGLLLATIGMLIGTALGLAAAYNLNWLADRVHDVTGYHPFPPDVYYLEKIPARVEWSELVTNAAVVMGLGVGFASPAAVIAAFRPPIRAIRHD